MRHIVIINYFHQRDMRVEVGIGFDKLTGWLYVQGTIDDVEIEEAPPLILKVLEGDDEQRENEIRKPVPMRGWIVGKALVR